MLVQEVVTCLEKWAPLAYQESYDNAGLIVGQPKMKLTGVVISLDTTEFVVEEAIQRGCNMIVSHHPIVFSGLKKFNGANYIERVVMKAIKHDIAIYAIHTNLDNMPNGVNAEICKRLGIESTQILTPKQADLKKLITYCPVENEVGVKSALFGAGCGDLGDYSEVSFVAKGVGSYRPSLDANPYLGEPGTLHKEEEVRIETLFAAKDERKIIKELLAAHPYEEVAYDILSLGNENKSVGAGMVGELRQEMSELDFLNHLKLAMKAGVVRYTKLSGKKIKRVAVCGGSGSFLLGNAIKANADVFVTSDFKYHQFFDANEQILIADIGHYECEQFTNDIIYRYLKEKFPTFALHLSEINTNPINYL